jgi:hypothetical protein
MECLLTKVDAKTDVNQKRLEAEMKTAQEITDASIKEMANMRTQIGYLESCTNVNREKA